MFNILLDRLPDDYQGYLIRSDFRIAIQIMLCLEDVEFNEQERIIKAFELLYGYGIPNDIETAYNGLTWFLNCGRVGNDSMDEEYNEKVTDFDIDSTYLLTAFRKTYGIDLKTAKLHWWEFQSMLADLDKCAYTNIVEIRSKKMSDCSSAEERVQYKKLKERFKLPGSLSDEDREALERFKELSGENFDID